MCNRGLEVLRGKEIAKQVVWLDRKEIKEICNLEMPKHVKWARLQVKHYNTDGDLVFGHFVHGFSLDGMPFISQLKSPNDDALPFSLRLSQHQAKDISVYNEWDPMKYVSLDSI